MRREKADYARVRMTTNSVSLALPEEQAHGIPLVSEGGLHANEDVAKLLAVDEQLLPIAVQVAGGLAPVLLQRLGVLAQLLVLVHLEAGEGRGGSR